MQRKAIENGKSRKKSRAKIAIGYILLADDCLSLQRKIESVPLHFQRAIYRLHE